MMGMALAAVSAATIFLGPGLRAAAQTASTTGATVTPPAAQAPALPYGAGEVVKMYQGGISKDVLVNYINSTVLPYHLTADAIIYLHGLGVAQEVTQAMIQRDGQLQQQQFMQRSYQAQMAAAAPAQNGAVAAQPSIVMPTTPAPAVTVIGDSGYPYYDYGYPYYYGVYGGPYYGGPLWYGGWGWRWGWGGRGWGWGHGYGHGGFGRGFGHGGYGGFHGGGGFHGSGGFHGGGGHGGGGHR
jgi:hypothetical protein